MNCPELLSKCDASYLALKQMLKDAEYQLAASQAREKVLLSAIDAVLCTHSYHTDDGKIASDFANNVINRPTDDTAIKAALKAEGERVIDEICEVVHEPWIVDAIRSLGDRK